MSKKITHADASFKLHIDGREAVELQAYEPGNHDQILVDAAFMRLKEFSGQLLIKNNELLQALKKCRFDSLNQSIKEWREIQDLIARHEGKK